MEHNIKKSESLKVLSLNIQCNVRCNWQIFQCLRDGRGSSDLFTIYTTYIRERMYNLVLQRTGEGKLLVNGGRVSILLIHWSIVAMGLSLFYHFTFTVLSLLQPILLDRNKWNNYTYIILVFLGEHIDWPVNHIIPYRKKSFLVSCSCM